MKKVLALIVALGMTCAMFAGCSEDESSTAAKTNSSSSVSSEADSSSEADVSSEADASSEAETTTTASSQEETTTTTTTAQETTTSASDTTSSQAATQQAGAAIKFEDSYTYKFQQSVKGKAFELDMQMKYMGVDMPIDLKMNGEDFSMKVTASAGTANYAQEYVCVNNVTYVLDHAKKQYTKYQGAARNATSVADVVPEGAYQVLSVKEENGLVAEQVKVTTTSSAGKETTSEATYYYDKATGVPKKMEVTTNGTKNTVNVTKFQIGAQTITVPDLTGWTDKNAAAANANT